MTLGKLYFAGQLSREWHLSLSLYKLTVAFVTCSITELST
jgi:hypothetical protein